MKKYKIIRDTKEKKGWEFEVTDRCAGMVNHKMKTADYTLAGLEDIFVIERKASTGEFAKNVVQDRFDRELVRLKAFPHSFMILEFTMADIINFPTNSGIPYRYWDGLKVTNRYILRRLTEYMVQYPTKIVLAGQYGKQQAMSIFNRMSETYASTISV